MSNVTTTTIEQRNIPWFNCLRSGSKENVASHDGRYGNKPFFLPRQPFVNSKDLIQPTESHRKQCQSLGGCPCDQADVYVSVGLPATCPCTAALDHDLMISFVLLKG